MNRISKKKKPASRKIPEPLVDETDGQEFEREPSLMEKLYFLKLFSEKQSKQLKQHRMEQDSMISLYLHKNAEFTKLMQRLTLSDSSS